MNKIKILIIFSIFLALSSCQFNQSVNTDLMTGAYSRGNGLGCDNITIEIDGIEESRNEFVYGEKVNFKFNNISGLKNVNGKTYPELSMHIIKNAKDTVLANPNLLKDLNDGTELNPLLLTANFSTALPYKNQENYVAFIKISDKKSDGTFSYELPFTVKESDILKVEKSGIEYSNIYLWNETLKKPVLNKKISSKHQYILILEGIKGLSENNEMVFPIFSIDIQDGNNSSVLASENILNYDDNGINSKDLAEQLVAKITFPQSPTEEEYTLIAKLKDKNSSNEIKVTTKLSAE